MSKSRKAVIIEEIQATHQPLVDALAGCSAEQMEQPGVNGMWSVKDVLAHITWWEQHLLRRLRTGKDDEDDVYNDENLADTDPQTLTAEVNEQIYAENHARPIEDILAAFDASYQELVAEIEGMAEDALASDEMYDIIGSDTFTHYPDHTAMLEAWKP